MIDWAGFIPAALLVSLIPGANQLLGLSNAVRHGPLRALAGVGGRLAAFVVLIGLVVAGLGAILAASATALEVIKWVGVIYLAWLGIHSLRGAMHAETQHAEATTRHGVRPIVAHEFAVAISNPKALLLFAALLPQFTDTTAPDANIRIALLGAAYLLIELLVGLLYIAAGRRIGATGIPARTQRRVSIGTGVTFLGMSALLAADDLT
ncbi:threonine/homoserine/homoserine lactone efflux protein [Catenuloplanes nepalensis]|uniref:Threonine/homoserine/homoserine lactone efflux protein n=1 Tax=Catenuloplanes nepalensis TaxID=587533 RepID=A0ABT9MMH1_9ACTN|nr:LysE family translocator [Catenuloplanes nepalensis]MDP9792638.1 threonine/homoserine/homoserine lactone efflux protein [Catenuloplanes nepalensis]